MSEEINDFDSLFENLDFEFEEEQKSEEEIALEKETAKTTKEEPEIVVPETEEDFLKSIEANEPDEIVKDEDEPDDEEEEEEEDDEEIDPSKYFEVVGKGLAKLGKFGEVPDDFKWTEENFLEKFSEISEKSAKEKINELLTDGWGEAGIEMFNDIFIKKVPVKEYLSAYGEAEDFSTLDMERIANQKLVVRTYLESMGVDEDEIGEQIELLEEKEKLQDRAEKYKEKLVEDRIAQMREMADRREAAIAAQKKAERERLTAITEVVSTALKSKEINGIPLSTSDDKELLRFVTAPAYKLQNGQQITELDKRLIEFRKDPAKWVALGKLIKEDLNVTPIKNVATDKKKEEVFNFVKQKKAPKQSEVLDQLDLLFKKKR